MSLDKEKVITDVARLRDELDELLENVKVGAYDTVPKQPAPPLPGVVDVQLPEPDEENPYAGPGGTSNSGNPYTDHPGNDPEPVMDPVEVVDVTALNTSDPVELGRIIVANALTQQGRPYGWGATGTDAWDCSALTRFAVKSATGKDIGRTTFDQIASPFGTEVPFTEARAGDLIFSNFSERGPEHVSINMDGPDDVVEAGNPVGVYKWGNRGRVVVKRFV